MDLQGRGREPEAISRLVSSRPVERESQHGISPTRVPLPTPEHADLQRGLEAPLPGKAPSESGKPLPFCHSLVSPHRLIGSTVEGNASPTP